MEVIFTGSGKFLKYFRLVKTEEFTWAARRKPYAVLNFSRLTSSTRMGEVRE